MNPNTEATCLNIGKAEINIENWETHQTETFPSGMLSLETIIKIQGERPIITCNQDWQQMKTFLVNEHVWQIDRDGLSMQPDCLRLSF